LKSRSYDSNPEGTGASPGISTSPLFSSERSLKISSAFANISSSLAALGSVAARAASRGRTLSDKDMILSPTPSLGGMEPGDCFIMLSLKNLRSKSVTGTFSPIRGGCHQVEIERLQKARNECTDSGVQRQIDAWIEEQKLAKRFSFACKSYSDFLLESFGANAPDFVSSWNHDLGLSSIFRG